MRHGNKYVTSISRGLFQYMFLFLAENNDQRSQEMHTVNVKVDKIEEAVVSVDAKAINIQKGLDQVTTFTVESRLLRANEQIMLLDEFTEKHDLNLPILTLEEFLIFDEKVAGDLCKDLVRFSKFYICALKLSVMGIIFKNLFSENSSNFDYKY